MGLFKYIFMIFCLTAVLIFTVQLRSTNRRIFYKYRHLSLEQDALTQQLWRKQLQLEMIVNPTTVSENSSEIEAEQD